MFPVLVCVTQKDEDYIEEFVKYHLALGFKRIYLYEDAPTYARLLETYDNVVHLPHCAKPLDHFVAHYLFSADVTHVAHLAANEFIVLKKHSTLSEFIDEFIVGDCQGVALNWRHFGSSDRLVQTQEPTTLRFTRCQRTSDPHIKTLFKKDNFVRFNTCHTVVLSSGHIQTTDHRVVCGLFNPNGDTSVAQLNRYKSKTFPEFRRIPRPFYEDVVARFRSYDCNETEDFFARDFFLNICDWKPTTPRPCAPGV
jgi:hypothetical protein